MFYQTKVEEREIKKSIRRERCVLWFYRWSQVLLAIFGITVAALFLFGILRAELLDENWKQVTLYMAIGFGTIGTALCFKINDTICEINERMNQHAGRKRGKNYGSGKSCH